MQIGSTILPSQLPFNSVESVALSLYFRTARESEWYSKTLQWYHPVGSVEVSSST